MNTDTKHTRQANYRQRQKEKGLTKLTVWVPPSGRKQVQQLAAKLREDTSHV